MVLFHCYDYLIPMKNLRFTSMKFWVQMCGLAISMLNSKTAMELGEKIGVVLSMKHSDEMIWGDFIQVRVEVAKPFCRGCRVALNEMDEVRASLKYEKLSNFCYWCGIISHTDKDCITWLVSKGMLSVDQ